MTINYATGETISEPVIVPQNNITRHDETIPDLPDGGVCYVETDALWVHPETDALHIDTHHGVTMPDLMDIEGQHMAHFARIMRYKGVLVVDLSHITDALAEQLGALGGESECELELPGIAKQTADRIESHSLVPDGDLILDGMHLLSFGALWEKEYGSDSALPLIRVFLEQPDQED